MGLVDAETSTGIEQSAARQRIENHGRNDDESAPSSAVSSSKFEDVSDLLETHYLDSQWNHEMLMKHCKKPPVLCTRQQAADERHYRYVRKCSKHATLV